MTQHDCVSLRERRAISKAWAIVPYSDETYGEGLPIIEGPHGAWLVTRVEGA